MTREQFCELRDAPGKVISDDIEWTAMPGMAGNLSFRDVVVHNEQGMSILLHGTYKPEVDSVTYIFVLEGSGGICRVDVNGTIHGDAGRTHKHDWRKDSDFRKNLPTAVPRPDLDGKSAREVWQDICMNAKITHTGNFADPI